MSSSTASMRLFCRAMGGLGCLGPLTAQGCESVVLSSCSAQPGLPSCIASGSLHALAGLIPA